MSIDNDETRAAYVQGATDAFAALHSHCAASVYEQVRRWIAELEQWQEGPPPRPPHLRK